MQGKLILQAVLEEPQRVIPVLLSINKIKLKDPKGGIEWANVEPGDNWLDNVSAYTEAQLEDYRALFPPNRKSSRGEMRAKLDKFFSVRTEYSMQDVLWAARQYVSETDPQYVCKSGYFISKKVPGEEPVSKLLDYLESRQDIKPEFDDEAC